MRGSVTTGSMLSGPERQLYGRLVRAFPGHVILAQVAVGRLLGDRDGAEPEPAASRHRLVADFVVCRPDFTALAVVEFADAVREGAARDVQPRKDELLQAAGIKVLRVPAADLPNEAALRALIAGLPVAAAGNLMRQAS